MRALSALAQNDRFNRHCVVDSAYSESSRKFNYLPSTETLLMLLRWRNLLRENDRDISDGLGYVKTLWKKGGVERHREKRAIVRKFLLLSLLFFSSSRSVAFCSETSFIQTATVNHPPTRQPIMQRSCLVERWRPHLLVIMIMTSIDPTGGKRFLSVPVAFTLCEG